MPLYASALIGINEPIIPCGLEGQDPCNFCHFFQLVQNGYNFIVFVIAPPLAIALVAIGSFLWITAGADEGNVKKGQKMLGGVAWGLVMVYVSWLVISFVIGQVAKGTAAYDPAKWWNPTTWFEVGCGAEPGGTPSAAAPGGGTAAPVV